MEKLGSVRMQRRRSWRIAAYGRIGYAAGFIAYGLFELFNAWYRQLRVA